MANLKLDNLISSIDILVKNNIITSINQLKESYANSKVYNEAKSSASLELSALCEEINNDINSLSNELTQFNDYLNNYINDYYLVNQYLTNGSQSEVKSIPTQKKLNPNLSVNNSNLEPIKVINLNLLIENKSKKGKMNYE